MEEGSAEEMVDIVTASGLVLQVSKDKVLRNGGDLGLILTDPLCTSANSITLPSWISDPVARLFLLYVRKLDLVFRDLATLVLIRDYAEDFYSVCYFFGCSHFFPSLLAMYKWQTRYSMDNAWLEGVKKMTRDGFWFQKDYTFEVPSHRIHQLDWFCNFVSTSFQLADVLFLCPTVLLPLAARYILRCSKDIFPEFENASVSLHIKANAWIRYQLLRRDDNVLRSKKSVKEIFPTLSTAKLMKLQKVDGKYDSRDCISAVVLDNAFDPQNCNVKLLLSASSLFTSYYSKVTANKVCAMFFGCSVGFSKEVLNTHMPKTYPDAKVVFEQHCKKIADDGDFSRLYKNLDLDVFQRLVASLC